MAEPTSRHRCRLVAQVGTKAVLGAQLLGDIPTFTARGAALLVHQSTAIAEAARLAAAGVSSNARLQELSVQLVADASVAIMMLAVVTRYRRV